MCSVLNSNPSNRICPSLLFIILKPRGFGKRRNQPRGYFYELLSIYDFNILSKSFVNSQALRIFAVSLHFQASRDRNRSGFSDACSDRFQPRAETARYQTARTVRTRAQPPAAWKQPPRARHRATAQPQTQTPAVLIETMQFQTAYSPPPAIPYYERAQSA